ncbi:hypothetical protein BN1088_1430241 [Sphingobacterium sp. PM2-P1-29]|nr:hypothetical protein BN1088_1430241 [Sphingobacterium sp. PM2-P1-29]
MVLGFNEEPLIPDKVIVLVSAFSVTTFFTKSKNLVSFEPTGIVLVLTVALLSSRMTGVTSLSSFLQELKLKIVTAINAKPAMFFSLNEKFMSIYDLR